MYNKIITSVLCSVNPGGEVILKKAIYLMLAIVLIFSLSIFYTFKWRQKNPETIPIADIVNYRSEQDLSVHFSKEGKLNINTATVQELSALSGIGNTLAQQIVQHRESNGPYETVYDLLKVKGIGEAKLNSIIVHICAE